MSSLISALIDRNRIELFTKVIPKMKSSEQRKYFNAIVTFSVKQYYSTDIVNKSDASIPASKTVSGVAGLYFNILKGNSVLKEYLVSSLTRPTITALDDSLAARRSAIAALAKDEGKRVLILYG